MEPIIIYKYKRYPSITKAQKKYYEKIKDTEHHKAIQRQSSNSYYHRNKEAILEKHKLKYQEKKKEKENNNLNENVNVDADVN